MIPYVCALLFSPCRSGGRNGPWRAMAAKKGFHSGPAILGLVGRGRIARYFGVLAILIPMVVYMYYVYIEAWCLRYAWEYLVGGVTLTGSIEEKVRGAAVFLAKPREQTPMAS